MLQQCQTHVTFYLNVSRLFVYVWLTFSYTISHSEVGCFCRYTVGLSQLPKWLCSCNLCWSTWYYKNAFNIFIFLFLYMYCVQVSNISHSRPMSYIHLQWIFSVGMLLMKYPLYYTLNTKYRKQFPGLLFIGCFKYNTRKRENDQLIRQGQIKMFNILKR